MTVGSLEAEDARSWAIQVAGPAALLVAKVYKIQDRQGTLRLGDKDALDVFRLLRGTSTEELAARFRRVLTVHRTTAAPAARWLAEQFGNPRGAGIARWGRSRWRGRSADGLRGADGVSRRFRETPRIVIGTAPRVPLDS